MNSFHFREGGGSKLPRLYTLPIYDFDLRATHARTLLPAALASVSSGFVLVRVLCHVDEWSSWTGSVEIPLRGF